MTVEESKQLTRLDKAELYYMAGLLSYAEYLRYRRGELLIDEAHEVEIEWKEPRT